MFYLGGLGPSFRATIQSQLVASVGAFAPVMEPLRLDASA